MRTKMTVYGRVIPVREKINKIGKLEWVAHLELLFNPTDEVLKEANFKKHVRYRCMYKGDYMKITDMKKLLSDTYAVKLDQIDILYYDN